MPTPSAAAALDALQATVDALLDPPGCEWNRAQTHRSLVTYLVEETFELVEAIEDGSVADVREELGDVLYQVVLHAGIAARSNGEEFDLADVMEKVDEKIRRRHPHVFGADRAEGGADHADGVDDIVRLWSAAKAREKAARTSAFDGVPPALPALARAQKILSRAGAAASGMEPGAGSGSVAEAGPSLSGARTEAEWGRALLAEVERASAAGLGGDGGGPDGFDAERALRTAVREREAALRAAEAVARSSV
ncbi:hypothetical protein AX769_08660 [Frondihabitans sp. PAMC 28766]|uniref:MazG nucleotide pyrophosphohydrolase domain-containing protein n=1 Tax=Frondihabitans sp. PAMC 28766 TaxID=1795630 RepID=UPI00078E67B1|nr:MazG nucleotide pyrophosphohydrolase domain-containing protein [Frondihabitans sp. PAMC 28766]AMM20223.1 hypothetical protein AX769_08660 [Frondihabitans sp. PAMC 28766]